MSRTSATNKKNTGKRKLSNKKSTPKEVPVVHPPTIVVTYRKEM